MNIGFALSRCGERISCVTVRLSDTRSVNKRCAIQVDLCPKSVRVEDSDADLFAAIDHAVHRVSRSVARALERQRAGDGVA
jgi:putative sigma-54 modulation protein